ncbi:hypothetical protein QCB45_00840 [Thiomicrorhabdus sp. ZW0627]|uniref:hypothetical protein n=1 Tax=Thiomicrorhabdus sp. ZW0627 TaxID=3039774 RepID=UPI0024366869|nr:hypothetical protein [Thiomicrorhabdus sp. ZW0627]MDG6772873.1 hypothetical protein [Thiomicrorhabdus sp. ZW0627]
MNITEVVKNLIRFIFALSPYYWVDHYYKQREKNYHPESSEWQALRDKRLFLSEFYIVSWLFLSAGLLVSTFFYHLPGWIAVLALFRILGIINKEIGVILFGICKITEGAAISATGRVIVLAIVNYITAMLLFSTVYQIIGVFEEVPDYLLGGLHLIGFIEAVNIHFTLSGPFDPANVTTWLLVSAQGMFCFAFGTIVLSLFVSLLNVKPLKA